jgi:hypothetical protein
MGDYFQGHAYTDVLRYFAERGEVLLDIQRT